MCTSHLHGLSQPLRPAPSAFTFFFRAISLTSNSKWPVDPSSKDAQCPAFRAVDDRVRGGSSQSHLTISGTGHEACFNGTLDTTTLGGAGFASQVTLDGPTFDLSGYDGVELIIGSQLGKMGSGERYVLLVKDTLEGDRGDGRDKSGVSWEYVFHAEKGQAIKAKWCDFKPTYRGREIDIPEGGLKTAEIKRIGFMMRSFFDAQSGSFSLPIRSVSAFKQAGQKNELKQTTTHHSTASSATRVGSHVPVYLEKGEKDNVDAQMTPEETKAKAKADKKVTKAERTKERDARTGIGALTGEMRDRGEGGQPGWRGYFNWLGRGCF